MVGHSRDAIEQDMELVEVQFSRPKANFRIVKVRLMSTQEIIESSSVEKALIEKAENMLQEAVEASKVLAKDE